MFPAPPRPAFRSVLYGVLCLSACHWCACSSLQPQVIAERLTRARASVEAAERADANQLAPESLRRAQDALAIATDAHARQEWERAARFARQAELYAAMAGAQTEERRLGEELTLVRQQLEEFQQKTQTALRDPAEAVEAVSDTPAASAPNAVVVQPAANTAAAQEGRP